MTQDENNKRFLIIILSFFAVMVVACSVIAYFRYQKEKQVELRILSGGYENK